MDQNDFGIFNAENFEQNHFISFRNEFKFWTTLGGLLKHQMEPFKPMNVYFNN